MTPFREEAERLGFHDSQCRSNDGVWSCNCDFKGQVDAIERALARVAARHLFELKKRFEARMNEQCSEEKGCDSYEHGYECLRGWEGTAILWDYMKELGLLEAKARSLEEGK